MIHKHTDCLIRLRQEWPQLCITLYTSICNTDVHLLNYSQWGGGSCGLYDEMHRSWM